jgi:hypothetical protein
MVFSEFEIKRIEKSVDKFMEKRRPAPHIRNQVDLGFKIKNQSLELFEIRPRWNNPSETIEGAIAKATYIKTKRIWKIYWQRQDLKWHGYQPKPEVNTVEEFLAVVDQDSHACFFG